MNNLDDTDTNAKISDSAYSNSCSNSQSRRSRSSKSTHSGSNSSGSSGYGGKLSISGSSNNNSSKTPKKDKEAKKKQVQAEVMDVEIPVAVDCRPPNQVPKFVTPIEDLTKDIADISSLERPSSEKGVENMDISSPEPDNSKYGASVCLQTVVAMNKKFNFLSSPPDGFSCVISMQEGVVLCTTQSLSTILDFPKDMWIGRSFIDFVHPKDRNTFASQISSGFADPKTVNGTQEKVPTDNDSIMICRIRKYKGLRSGFGVKEVMVSYLPFQLKFIYKNINDEEVFYYIVEATPVISAFKIPNEKLLNPTPFVIRHDANGILCYIDTKSVPYLGYLPQDIINQDVLQLYHRDDLPYLKMEYDAVVKEGSLNRSKPYRILTQNGGYIKLETEWTSYINPWSRKLVYITAKNYIIEGPIIPDVFQSSIPMTKQIKSEEERNTGQGIRGHIIRVLNEVMTKPAKVAKQQMTKRCQELASFIESLSEKPSKANEDLRLEIQVPDHCYYERDLVLLGGISPHHEHTDGNSSTETQLSYNQVNYNENLQRYFNSHERHYNEDYNIFTGDNIFGQENVHHDENDKISSAAQDVSGSSGFASSSDSNSLSLGHNNNFALPGNSYKLTETLISKHNTDMEREFLKYCRENRSCTKEEREKVNSESRKKKKEHLARCNAPFQTTTPNKSISEFQHHGLKRASKTTDRGAGAYKQHCPSPRQSSKKSPTCITQPPSTVSATPATPHWSQSPANNVNPFIMGVRIPQQMSLMSPISSIPSMYPMYCTPTAGSHFTAPGAYINNSTPSCTGALYQPQPVHCMYYGQPVYGSPYMYSPVNPQVSYQVPLMDYSNMHTTIGLPNNNFEQACMSNLLLGPNNNSEKWHGRKCFEFQATPSKTDHPSGQSSTDAFVRRSEQIPDTSAVCAKSKTTRTSEGTVDKTDGESSYSSFYSSFFKTESGSVDDSDAKKEPNYKKPRNATKVEPAETKEYKVNLSANRKVEPTWMDQVCLTPELIYKYQIMPRSLEEVLEADKETMKNLQQPSLVDEQLGQLYLDLQLEGVAAKLSLDEGITSSSSSSEEILVGGNKSNKYGRKRHYSKLMMIYEEDAPLPSASDNEELKPAPST